MREDLIERLRRQPTVSQYANAGALFAALIAEREEAAAALEAAREDVWHLEPWRDAVFDGVAVFAALNRNAKPRTSHENVADVLDAVANVARSAIDQARGEGVQDEA